MGAGGPLWGVPRGSKEQRGTTTVPRLAEDRKRAVSVLGEQETSSFPDDRRPGGSHREGCPRTFREGAEVPMGLAGAPRAEPKEQAHQQAITSVLTLQESM